MRENPVLSIGMIFKNEIRCLERCMKSLEPLRRAIPCELVMADTGSTDGSREVAEKYADILIDFPWINDFAAARNAVLDRCSGEWYMSVDSDEWLDAEADLPGLAAFFAAGPQGNGFAVQILNLQSAQERGNYSVYWLPRLVRRRGELLRYQGAIHETPCYEEKGKAVSPGPYQRLSAMRFYHDGYLEENKAEKSKRNMALLRQKLERNPRDLLCLLQCVQSSGDFQEGLSYARRMLETARQSTDPRDGPLLPAVYQTAIQTAYGASAEAEVYGWLAEAEEKLPKSMLIRVDGNGYAALMAYKREDLGRCASYGARWREGLAAWDLGEGNDYVEQAFGHLYLVNPYMRQALGCRILDALCGLGDWERGQAWVEFLAALPVSVEFLGRLTGLLMKYSGHLRVSAGLAALWRQCLERYRSEDAEARASGETGLRTMLRELGSLPREDRRAWEAVAGMGDCDPGRSARILLARNAGEAQAELAGIEAWEHVLYPAAGRLTELGVPLPEGFLRQPSEILASIASALSEAGWDMTELALRGDAPEEDGDLARLLWDCDLAAAAMLRADWAEARGDALCNRFLELEREAGRRLYHFEAVTEESVSVLPGVHRFGWCLLLGQERLAQGDRAGYVRALRLGVRETPDMKQAAAFLLERVERNQQALLGSPELLALAEQVRTVLAMYPADDPAVAALKASPAYKRVAHLIEG